MTFLHTSRSHIPVWNCWLIWVTTVTNGHETSKKCFFVIVLVLVASFYSQIIGRIEASSRCPTKQPVCLSLSCLLRHPWKLWMTHTFYECRLMSLLCTQTLEVSRSFIRYSLPLENTSTLYGLVTMGIMTNGNAVTNRKWYPPIISNIKSMTYF